MKKRIISIGLVVCMILSVLTLSTMGAFAAEEALYAPIAKTEAVAFDFNDVTEDAAASGTITNENGSVTVVNATSLGTVASSKDGDALKVVATMNVKQAPTVNIDIKPANVNTEASKTVTTLKFKNTYTDKEGNPITESKDTSGVCNVEFRMLGQDNDGTVVSQAGALYGTGSAWRKGARGQHGITNYAAALGQVPTADADGYYSIRIESFKDESGVQHTDVYGEGCTQPIVRNIYVGKDETGAYADKLGYGARVSITFTGNDPDSVQTLWLKDAKVEYEAAKGSIKSVETYNEGIFPLTVSEDGLIHAETKPATAMRTVDAVFSSYRPVEKGNIQIDFKLKKDPVVVTNANGDFRRCFDIGGTDGKRLRFVGLATDGKTFIPYDLATSPYFAYSGSVAPHSIPFATDDSVEWESLRIVVSRDSVDDAWSVALFDLDASETVPVCTTFDKSGIGNFTSLNYAIYGNANAWVNNGSGKPNYAAELNVKDFSMKITDDIVSSASYSNSRGTNPTTGSTIDNKFFTQTPLNNDPDAVVNYEATWTGNIYVNSNKNVSVLLAVYSVNGNLLGVKILDKNNGLKNGFNKDVQITIDNLPTTWKISKKLFIIEDLGSAEPLVKTCEDMHPDFMKDNN